MEGTTTPEPREGLDELRRAACTDDRAARRAAADQLGTLLQGDFDDVFDATQPWVLDPDERLREVACRALAGCSEQADEVRTRRMIGRAELFLPSKSPTIAAIASREVLPNLLARHPAIIPEWTRRWIEDPDERVRIGLATVFGALAPRFPGDAVPALAELGADPRPRVHEAVGRAITGILDELPTMESYLRTQFPSYW